jgi:hypothetical protein
LSFQDSGLLLTLQKFFGITDMTTVFYAYHNFYWDRHMWDANPLSFTRKYIDERKQ